MLVNRRAKRENNIRLIFLSGLFYRTEKCLHTLSGHRAHTHRLKLISFFPEPN